MLKVDAALITAMRQSLAEQSNLAYGEAINALTAGYPEEEIKTFDTQKAEVKAWALDSNSPTPWIDIAAANRGIPREIYLQRTFIKAQLYLGASAALTGRRQAIDDAIKVAPDAQALASIQINYSLPGAP